MEHLTQAQNDRMAEFFRVGRMGHTSLRQAVITVHSIEEIAEGMHKGAFLAQTTCAFSKVEAPFSYVISFGPCIKDLVPINEPFYGLLRGAFGDGKAPYPISTLMLIAPLSVNPPQQ